MNHLFSHINPQAANKLINANKEKFAKIQHEYDRHDDGYTAEEHKITCEQLTKHLNNKPKKPS